MSWTPEDLDALNESLKKGLKRVEYPGGHLIEYQSISDMLKLRQAMILEINSTKRMKPYAKVDFQC